MECCREEVALSTGAAEVVSVVRPWGWPEAGVAVPAAVLAIATGAISLHRAQATVLRLGPVLGFLAAVLVLAQLCQDEGLFRACGAWARPAGSWSTTLPVPSCWSGRARPPPPGLSRRPRRAIPAAGEPRPEPGSPGSGRPSAFANACDNARATTTM
jgi:hypothetical protein